MTFWQKEFSFTGRLSRLPFFGLGILNMIVVIAVTAAGAALALSQHQDPASQVFGIVLIAAVWIAGFWAGLAVTIKRLHDMGLVGTHAIWIYLLGGLGGGLVRDAPAAATVVYVIAFGVWLWLVFQPGTDGPNRYGPEPGFPPMRRVPYRAEPQA